MTGRCFDEIHQMKTRVHGMAESVADNFWKVDEETSMKEYTSVHKIPFKRVRKILCGISSNTVVIVFT